ncbi:MAG: ComEC/Rec2 family competence protein [Deltaproteobacteria bacterium]|nr:MAG: ComEC/Rec2 family competence protein [Deltaproteobacteria bacterium]
MTKDKVDSRLVLRESPEKNNLEYKVLATLETSESGVLPVLLKFPSEVYEALGGFNQGDVLKCFVKWKEPFRYKNPGTPDYRKILLRQKVFLTASIYHEYDCVVEERHTLKGLDAWINSLRQKSVQEIQKNLSPLSAIFIQALTLGDRSGFQKEDWDLFQKTGTTHLIAVSGLHLTLIGGIFYFLILFFLKRSEAFMLLHSTKAWAMILSLLPMAVFVLVTGSSVSAWRAWMMLAVLATSLLLSRDRDHWSTLAFAFLILTILNPASLFSISFQLSFLAIVGLIVSEKFIEGKSFWKKTIIASVSIFLTTAACVILHFNKISLSGIVHNLWAIPYTNALLLLSFILISLESFSLPYLTLGWKLLDILSQWFLKILKVVSAFSLQFSFYPDSFESVLLMVVTILIFVWIVLPLNRRQVVIGFSLVILSFLF